MKNRLCRFAAGPSFPFRGRAVGGSLLREAGMAHRLLLPVGGQLQCRSSPVSVIVPVIDIAAWSSGEAAAKAAIAASVDRAFTEVGFLVLSGHGVAPAVIDRAYQAAIAFFEQPVAEKLRHVAPDVSIFRGYNGPGTQRSGGLYQSGPAADLRENYMMSRIDIADAYFRRAEFMNTYAPNILPQQPADYRPAWEDFYVNMEALSFRVIQICAAALGLREDWFMDKVDKHSSTCVANFYPAQPDAPLPGQLRAGAHADVGSITLLIQDQAQGGLQILGKDEAWHDVVTAPYQVVVNVGDLLGRWTNDHWKSTKHRVVNPPREFATTRRLSMTFFQHPNFDAEVRCIETCIPVGGTPRYEPVVAGEQIHARMMRARVRRERDVESEVPEAAGEGTRFDATASAPVALA
jgi:isopenicillin N synthase-like dioxygenase